MLTRWSDRGAGGSFAALDAFRREMEQVFRRLDEDWSAPFSLIGAEALSMGGPRLHMKDNADEVVVMAELPGFKADDIKVSVEQGTLTIRGERGDDAPEGYVVHRKERGAMRFAQTVTLPARIEPDEVRADLKHGVLELHMPKTAAARPRNIAVKAS